MSDEQLGWNQILKTAREAAEVKVTTTSTPEVVPEAPKKTAPKKSRKKKASAEPADNSTKFAEKNWGALDFPAPAVLREPVEKTVEIPSEKLPPAPAVTLPPEVQTVVEPEILSVSQINRYIRDILEGRFPVLWLKAEISNFKAHTSGHFYFSLKDAKAQISAVMFRGFNSQLRFRPQDGMEVIVRGKVTVYEPRGNYQIFCELMEPVGAGALQKAFEQLKAKLQREGLFDEARKRPLPALPKHIAIVTSPTGAAIRDMLNVLNRRFKGVRITLIPCKVQGDQAPGEIVNAIQLANRLPDVDVMILGRGGGSIEDLWAFNEEKVARAIAASAIPVISAVGHEVDFTIADFVADLRAPTPSAAAELVVRNVADLLERVNILQRTLKFSILRKLNSSKQDVVSISRRLIDPQRRIQDAAIRCDELLQRLENGLGRFVRDQHLKIELLLKRLGSPLQRVALERESLQGLTAQLRSGIRNTLTRKRERLQKDMAVLDSLSPLKVLDRGYSMVMVGDKVITKTDDIAIAQTISIRLSEGRVQAQVTKIEKD